MRTRLDLPTDDLPDRFRACEPERRPDKVLERYTRDGYSARVVAYYRPKRQEWLIRKQIEYNGDWVESDWGKSLEQTGPDNHPLQLALPRNFAKRFTGGILADDPLHVRVLSGVIDAVRVFWWAVSGDRYRVVALHEKDWTPGSDDE